MVVVTSGAVAGPHAVANVPEVHDDAVGEPRSDRLRERSVCGDGQPSRAEVVSQKSCGWPFFPSMKAWSGPRSPSSAVVGDGLHEGPFRATTP